MGGFLNWSEWSWKKLEAETHPVVMLVDLVISDELDPWDIDIADIANRFIKEVKKKSLK